MLGEDAHGLLDIARIAPQEQRLEVLHCADHGSRLPLERRLAPAVQPGLIGFHAHEHPVAHLRVAYQCFDGGDFQMTSVIRELPSKAVKGREKLVRGRDS